MGLLGSSMEKNSLPDLVQRALEKTVGLGEKNASQWELLANRIGIAKGTLRNKISDNKEDKRHHITLSEAIAIVEETRDHSIVHALCTHFKGEFLAHPGLDDVSNEELFKRYTNMMKELGQFSIDINESLIDGVITRNEIEKLQKDFLRLTGAISEMMDRLQEKADHDAETPKIRVN